MNEFLDGPTKLRKKMICICIDDLGEGMLGYALITFICHFMLLSLFSVENSRTS